MNRRIHIPRILTLSACSLFLFSATFGANANPFTVRQIADTSMFNRNPVISETGLVAWKAFSLAPDAPVRTDIYIYQNGEMRPLTGGLNTDPDSGNYNPQVYGNQVVWTATLTRRPVGEHTPTLVDPPLDQEVLERDARFRVFAEYDEETRVLIRQWTERVGAGPYFEAPPTTEDGVDATRRSSSGNNEIMLWDGEKIRPITIDIGDDLGPGFWGDTIAWQKARSWPFGWEIMLWVDGYRAQLTTNFFYDMAPRVHNQQVVWYGWDGSNYQIFLHDHPSRTTTKITETRYDDVSPQIWDGAIVWEGYVSIGADIFMWKDGETTRLSDSIDDDINPRIWNGQVVWQGFDGDFFQIYHFDGTNTVRLTNTRYDNVQPDIRDGVITWMGYVDNFDAEIFAWTGGPEPIRLTDNDYDDQAPRTAGGRIVWQADSEDGSFIFLAEP